MLSSPIIVGPKADDASDAGTTAPVYPLFRELDLVHQHFETAPYHLTSTSMAMLVRQCDAVIKLRSTLAEKLENADLIASLLNMRSQTRLSSSLLTSIWPFPLRSPLFQRSLRPQATLVWTAKTSIQ